MEFECTDIEWYTRIFPISLCEKKEKRKGVDFLFLFTLLWNAGKQDKYFCEPPHFGLRAQELSHEPKIRYLIKLNYVTLRISFSMSKGGESVFSQDGSFFFSLFDRKGWAGTTNFGCEVHHHLGYIWMYSWNFLN